MSVNSTANPLLTEGRGVVIRDTQGVAMPVPCHFCNKLIGKDAEDRYHATHSADPDPWTCYSSHGHRPSPPEVILDELRRYAERVSQESGMATVIVAIGAHHRQYECAVTPEALAAYTDPVSGALVEALRQAQELGPGEGNSGERWVRRRLYRRWRRRVHRGRRQFGQPGRAPRGNTPSLLWHDARYRPHG
jgi:hypothetical protein